MGVSRSRRAPELADMTARNQRRRASSSEREPLRSRIARVLDGTSQWIITASALIAAVFGIAHYWTAITSSGSTHVAEASFHEARVEPQISLEEYEP
jgi:hypothetical protein